MKNLSFWAQSLDNQSPDILVKDGEELSDDKLRQELVSEIYAVTTKKEISPPGSSVTVRYSDPKFVIEAIPTEKDEVNRIAPIVIYGELRDDFSLEWIEEACDEIEKVVSDKIKRTLHHSTLEAIRNWLTQTLEKKKKVDLQNQIISLFIGFIAPLLVGWLIQSRDLQLTTLQVAGLIALNNLLVMSFHTFVTSKFPK